MDILLGVGKRLFLFLRKNKFNFFIVSVYVFFTLFYMGPSFYNCNDAVYGFGDSTGGPIWRNSLEGQPLLGGYEKETNFPTGESLYSPVNIVSLVQLVFMRVTNPIVGDVCAYNLYNATGYITTALVTFAFIMYLTRSKWIALLAGYAVAYTPYVQSKIGGHPSYAFGALLVALIWLSLILIRNPRIKIGVFMGIILSICAYIDPYFILLSATIMLPIALIIVACIIVRLRKSVHRDWLRAISRALLAAIVVFGVLSAPIAYTRIKDAAIIESSVTGIRGNVFGAAMLCSNKPIDYVLPDPLNFYLLKIFGEKYISSNIAHRNWCGYGESRVSISLVAISLLAIATAVLLVRRRLRMNASPISANNSLKLATGTIIAVGSAAILVGLPPEFLGITTPSGVVLKITETWRIFAREYLVVNIAVIVLFAIALKYLAQFIGRKWVGVLIYLLIFLGISFEYQINPPFSPPVFSYSRDVPQVYRQIKNDPNIKAIAEYPIDRLGLEYDSAVYYLTMQAVHGKAILNPASLKDPNESLHMAIRDLSDPQSIPALRQLGIHYVVIHGVSREDVGKWSKDLDIIGYSNPPIYSLNMLRPDEDKDIILAKLKDGVVRNEVVVVKSGLTPNTQLIKSPFGSSSELASGAELGIESLSASPAAQAMVCFDVRTVPAAGNGPLTLRIASANGAPLASSVIGGQYTRMRLTLNQGDSLKMTNDKNMPMEIDNLGC